MASITRFFKDNHGRLVIWQTPNLPLSVWAICTALGAVIQKGWFHNGVSSLGQAAIIVWAYLELRSGQSPFRRMLGGIILAFIIYGFFAT